MQSRPIDDHHWVALWLLCVGAIAAGAILPESTMGGMFMGAGFVWLMLVE